MVRSDLFGLQSSADKGECSQTGHDEGNDDWPVHRLVLIKPSRIGAKPTCFADRLLATG